MARSRLDHIRFSLMRLGTKSTYQSFGAPVQAFDIVKLP